METTLTFYYLDSESVDDKIDLRLELRGSDNLNLTDLAKIGVLHWKLDGSECEQLNNIA